MQVMSDAFGDSFRGFTDPLRQAMCELNVYCREPTFDAKLKYENESNHRLDFRNSAGGRGRGSGSPNARNPGDARYAPVQ